jgi:hypothetical protein
MPWAAFTAHLPNGTCKRVDTEACYELTTAERPHGLRVVVALDAGDLAFVNADSAAIFKGGLTKEKRSNSIVPAGRCEPASLLAWLR